jgi:hypothetical protein
LRINRSNEVPDSDRKELIMRSSKMSLIVAVLSVGLAVPAIAGPHDGDGRQGRYDERTYERMRELAHVLDERAQHAAHQAIGSAHHGGRAERRFLSDITHFSRQAADFHRRMDRYRESPWDVPGEINHLTDDARRVNRQIRSAHLFEHTWDDWAGVLDVLNRMQQSSVADRGHDRYGDRVGDRDGDRGYRRY